MAAVFVRDVDLEDTLVALKVCQTYIHKHVNGRHTIVIDNLVTAMEREVKRLKE